MERPFSQEQLVDEVYTGLDLSERTIDECEFDGCEFRNVVMNAATVRASRFVDCTFAGCDLSLMEPIDSVFSGCAFEECRITGVNWSMVIRRDAAITEPNSLTSCDLSLSNFAELDLTGWRFVDCRVNETGFRETVLVDAHFERADLAGADFAHADLSGATLIDCPGLYLDSSLTKLTGATVSAATALQIVEALGLRIHDPER